MVSQQLPLDYPLAAVLLPLILHMNTRLITSVPELQSYLRELRARGRSLGLVPTMGALHEGHQSLIRRAKQQCDAVVVSIFVNPMQFSSSEDLAHYPRDLQKDAKTLRALNVDVIFAPRPEDIYPAGIRHLCRARQARHAPRRRYRGPAISAASPRLS